MPTRTALCTICQRQVYLSEQESPECPVCSSPLIETAQEPLLEAVPKPGEPQSEARESGHAMQRALVELPSEAFLG